MNKALIQHAQHDIHRYHRRQDQPQCPPQRGLERQRRPLELGGDIFRHIEIFFRQGDGVDRFPKRIIAGHVKGDGGRRELIEMIDR
ncbi:hypothetical protein D3C85_1546160 [compost metagenome]